MLSEKGSLSDTPVMKLLLTVFELGLTGILYIKKEDVLKVLYFSRGKMIWAISNSDDDKLENVLISRDLTDAATIRKIKADSRVSESIGKLLVEKGLITLEELIDASKEQLKRIMRSVLKWREGGFQFIKDQPPERLLSLDLNVTDFIIDYIVEDVEISEIWKEIGSLQLELIKNPDEAKLAKYHLTDRQRELLNSFDGDNRLEGILSRQAGGHRESLLKIIYFFMMSELLIKKEFELSDGAIFETGEGKPGDFVTTNSDEPFETYTTAEIDKSIVDIPVIRPQQGLKSDDYFLGSMDEPLTKRHTEPKRLLPLTDDTQRETIQEPIAKKNQPVFDWEDTVNPKNKKEPSPEKNQHKPLSQSTATKKGRTPTGKSPFLAELHQEEKKRSKLFTIVLILIFLIFVVGGIILLVLPMLQSSPSPQESIPKAEKTADIYFQETPVKKETTTVPPKTEPPITTTTETKEGEGKASEPPKEDVKPVQPIGKSAFSYFQQGNYITAGDVWKRELQAAGINYSIMLEMDCLKESVVFAYKRTGGGDNFFILNRLNGNRNCFLVMWGKYKSMKEATDAIKTVPASFWKQNDPPEVVELAQYF